MCVNPSHLFLGTQKENQEDMVSKERENRGECRPQSKLTETDVVYIRKVCKLRDPKFGLRALARHFGVSKTAISYVVTGRNWRYLV